jgi:hypothetical protein
MHLRVVPGIVPFDGPIVVNPENQVCFNAVRPCFADILVCPDIAGIKPGKNFVFSYRVKSRRLCLERFSEETRDARFP